MVGADETCNYLDILVIVSLLPITVRMLRVQRYFRPDSVVHVVCVLFAHELIVKIVSVITGQASSLQ